MSEWKPRRSIALPCRSAWVDRSPVAGAAMSLRVRRNGSCTLQAVGRPPAVEVFIRRRSRLAVDPQLTERLGGMEAVEFRLGLVEQLVEESAERCWRAVLVGIGEHDRRIRWRICGYAGQRLDPTVRASMSAVCGIISGLCFRSVPHFDLLTHSKIVTVTWR